MKKRGEKQLSMPRNILFLLKLIWHENKILLFLLAVEAVCSVAIPFFGIYLPRIAIDLLETNAATNVILSQLGGFITIMTVVYFMGRYASSARYWLINDFRPLLMLKIFIKSLYCEYGDLESPEGQKRYRKAIAALEYGDECATSRLIPALMSFSVGILGFFLYSGVLLTLHPVIVVLLIATSLITYFTTRYAVKYERNRKDETSAISKRLLYIDGKTADFQYGKDVRIYNMRQLIFSVREGLISNHMKLSKKIQGKWYFTKIIDAAITLLRDGFAYVYLIWMVSNGRITIADFVFYFGAIAGFSSWLTSIVRNFSTINGTQLELSDIRSYLEQPDAIDPQPAAEPPDYARAPSIRFEDVSFSYAGNGQKVLDDFSIFIRPGEKIALVGVNGAGKTTLVKLLCGFYKPDKGRILINDVDIAMYKREDLFALFSAVFQDMMILPYTLSENVALQSSSSIDREKVMQSLRQAGLLDFVEKLPSSIDTPMHRMHDEKGIHLSGGQQQKLLLARALYKNAPVLILDEPSAALDPIAESELYQQYHRLVSGKTALYISHRLASTRFCDRIVYLHNGQAQEVGSHDELMLLGQGYAHMYEVQSHYYKENAKEVV